MILTGGDSTWEALSHRPGAVMIVEDVQQNPSTRCEKIIINKGINNIPNILKYGMPKIKNKNLKRAISSDIANMVVDEAQNKINKKFSDTLF